LQKLSIMCEHTTVKIITTFARYKLLFAVSLGLLSPQLKSLKAGSVEVELQTRESTEIDTTLSPCRNRTQMLF
jgi:hypothetical protein